MLKHLTFENVKSITVFTVFYALSWNIHDHILELINIFKYIIFRYTIFNTIFKD